MDRAYAYGKPLPAPVLEQLRSLVEACGQYEAADRVGVGASTIARALAGLGVRRATATAIEARLALIAK